jgi:hypothetical protein
MKTPTFLCRWSLLHRSPPSAKTAMMFICHGVCVLFVWQIEIFSYTAESIEWFIEGRAAFRRKIWLVVHPLPLPLPSRKLDRRHTGRQRKRDNLLTEGGGVWGRARSRIMRPQESLVLCKLISNLCYTVQAYERVETTAEKHGRLN